jgi:hypothetical protein
MTTLTAIVRNGQLELPEPLNLPDGTRVEVRLLESNGTGPSDEEGPMTPEEIARTLAAMQKIEPFEMTPEEEAAVEAARKARKEWEKAHFDEHAAKLQRGWE